MERIWRGEVKMNVIKRNCEIAEFDKTKISQAILKAMKYGSGINLKLQKLLQMKLKKNVRI